MLKLLFDVGVVVCRCSYDVAFAEVDIVLLLLLLLFSMLLLITSATNSILSRLQYAQH